MIDRNPSSWIGCLPRKSNAPHLTLQADSETFDEPLKHWIRQCVPTYNQKGDSCVGEGWANYVEIIVRSYVAMDAIPRGMQLNGYAVWAEAKRLFYNNVLNGGLQLYEGFYALQSLGWIPEDTELVEVGEDWISQGKALMDAPLVVGHMVHQGWFDPNPENGCLDHAPLSAKEVGGHCTCRIGRHVQKDRRFYSALNSWGPDYANYGIFLMDEEMDENTILDTPYTIYIPGGFERLREHRGWEAGLIVTPRGNS